MGFSIFKTQLNHHLRSNILVTAKKPIFETEVINSVGNLQTVSERFTEAYNAVPPAEIPYNFTRYSKRQIIHCYNKTQF